MAELFRMVRAECYKAARRPYLAVSAVVFFLSGLGVSALFAYLKYHASNVPEQVNFPFAVTGVLFTMVMGLYLVVLGADLVFSEQYKHNTLKNEVSFGLSRVNSYLSRWITALLSLLFLFAVLVLPYLLGCLLLLGIPSDAVAMDQYNITSAESVVMAFQALGRCILASLPLWIGGLSVILCLFFLFSSSTFAAFAYAVSLQVVPAVLEKLGKYIDPIFTSLYRITLSYPFNDLMSCTSDWGFIGRCWAIGLVWTLASTAAGLLLFRRKEIK